MICEVDPGTLARLNSALFGTCRTRIIRLNALPEHIETLIIGAGLAGLSTAFHHDGPFAILEKEAWVGGKARSEQIDGFTFDVTGHWLHLRDPDIRKMVLDLMGEAHFMGVRRMSRIWSHGAYTRYPFQANTFGLPPDVIKECVMGAVEADRSLPDVIQPEDEPANFADWIRFYFGEGIARHFMIPYNAKLWGVRADEITSRWCQRFVPRPRLDEIVAGAVGCNEREMGYNAEFLYPRQGGIQTVAEGIADAVGREHIFLERTVQSIDLENRRVTLSDGETVRFDRLVNTMALPRFIDSLSDVPSEVVSARHKLRANEVVYLNVGIQGALGQPDHWIYVPEEKWPMYRVGSFSNANPNMAPDGCSSLYIELSDRDTPLDELKPRIVEGLCAMNLISSPDQILFMHSRRIKNAYVIYDFDYHACREEIHEWVGAHGVWSIGRYGDWNYSSMEDALIDGRRTAAELMEAR
jgi:protoporphyrinogen oxidase